MKTRRQLLRLSLFCSLIPVAVIVTRCSQVAEEPVPFQTGEVVGPPLGCTELRANDRLGDCG